MPDRAFSFLRVNQRSAKPRATGLTEIRGPYYTPLGKRQLEDILETMGEHVDSLKFAGGSFSLMPRAVLMELLTLCHDHDVLVSTGGFIEYVLTQGPDAVNRYRDSRKRRSLPGGWRSKPAGSGLSLLMSESHR
jgi:phosphosulfolactate synthase (CoM biosynthesis protein A)